MTSTSETGNVALRLSSVARAMPDAVAIAEPLGYGDDGRRQYRQVTFRELDDDSSQIASGLRRLGVRPGMRLALLVRPGIDFICLVFALFKAGAVAILIDPGMGRRNLISCLSDAEPEGFVAIPIVQAVRTLMRRRFPKARLNVTVGRRWFWGGPTLNAVRRLGSAEEPAAAVSGDDEAAIIFTTGSTGPPKGVLYRHGNFDAQVEQLRDFYGVRPGEIDLPCFPLFGLFNCAMGVTAVIPEVDPTRPAKVDPAKVIEAARDWKVTQAFGSPAVWNRVGPYCVERGIRLETLRRVLSAGAPVGAAIVEAMRACIHPEGDIHTPYGATEALPVASIAGTEILAETAARTREGRGVCVGRRFPGIQWRVIRIVDGPIRSLDEAETLPAGEIGELIVHGAVVTERYVTRVEANALGKIVDNGGVWHRMGDVGYLDAQERFWFCGRAAHRVLTAQGPLYTIPCEAIFNQHQRVFRTALVGVGPRGRQRPVIIAEPKPGCLPQSAVERETLLGELRELGRRYDHTRSIDAFLIHPAFPVDIRHNAKIFREKLAIWAAGELQSRGNDRS